MVTGLRRTGKTSLVQTSIVESTLPHLIVNGRAFADEPTIKKEDLLRVLEQSLNEAVEREKRWRRKILEALSGIWWLKVDSKPPWVHFEWKRPSRDLDILDVVHSFNRMARGNRTKFILVLDEAQEFRKLKGYKLQNLMAYVYDEVRHVQVIVTGSQFGLLHDFLGIDDPESPLFGRGIAEISTPRLSSKLAEEFMVKGFGQAEIEPDMDMVRSAVTQLDGIIGWLTFLGARSVERGSLTKEILNETIEKGSVLEAKEFSNFLKTREQARRRYIWILKTAARFRRASWGELKKELELRERKSIANNVFTDLIKNLVNAAFLAKGENGEYYVADPILSQAILTDLVR